MARCVLVWVLAIVTILPPLQSAGQEILAADKHNEVGLSIRTPLLYWFANLNQTPVSKFYPFLALSYRRGTNFQGFNIQVSYTGDYYQKYLSDFETGTIQIDSVMGHPPSIMTDSTKILLGRNIKGNNYSIGVGLDWRRPVGHSVFTYGTDLVAGRTTVKWANMASAVQVRSNGFHVFPSEVLMTSDLKSSITNLSLGAYVGYIFQLSNKFSLAFTTGIIWDNYWGEDIDEVYLEYWLYKKPIDPLMKVHFYNDAVVNYRF